MADTVATLANALKTRYEPEFTKAFNEEFVGWQLATKGKRDFKGGSEVFGVQIGRAGGVGSRGETQGLPKPSGPTPLQASVPLARMYHVFEISHDAIERSIGDDAAWKALLGWEIETGFDRLHKLGNIYFYGDGKGILSTVVTGATLTATVGNSQQLTVDTTRYLEANDLITIWRAGANDVEILSNGGQLPNAGTTPKDETIRVKSVDSATLVTVERVAGTGTEGASTVIVATNFIRLFGESTTTANTGGTRTDNVFAGLGLFADTTSVSTTFEGINRSNNPRWQGQVIDMKVGTVPQNMARNDLYRLNDKIRRNSPARGMDTAIWDVSLRREYLNLLQPDIRYAPVKDLDGGYKDEALKMSLGTKSVDLVEDVDVPFGTMFGFAREYLHWMELSPLQLDASTGSALKQAMPYGVAGSGDIFYGYARCKGNFGTDCAPAFGKLINIAYTSE